MGQKMPVIPVSFNNVSDEAQWYTIVTKFNYESKFVKDLFAGLKNVGLENNIIEVVLPFKEHREIIKDSKGKEKEKVTVEKVMPLYVFVKAIMTERVFYYMRNTAGCANIMAAGGSLLVTKEEDILNIKQKCGLIEKEKQQQKQKQTAAIARLVEEFKGKPGQQIKVIGGAFEGYVGTLQKINFSKGKASVVFENGLPIEVDLVDLQIA